MAVFQIRVLEHDITELLICEIVSWKLQDSRLYSDLSLGSLTTGCWGEHIVKAWRKLHNEKLYNLYSVWLQTGLPRFDLRQRQRIFPVASVSRPALRPTEPPIQWIPWILSAVGAWRWPLTPIYFRGQEWVWVIAPLPLVVCMAVAGQLYFYYFSPNDEQGVAQSML
jgi:hypothetical protein